MLDICTWEETLQELIRQEEFQAKWTLKLDQSIVPDHAAPGWKQHQQKAFGRFWCSVCDRSWTSAQVKILCHMYWEPWKSQGQILMRIFAQRCQKCSWSEFENPEFPTDSMMRILENLARHILQRYYGHNVRQMPVIREGTSNRPHDTGNCEACTLGYCVRGSLRCIAEPSKFPHPAKPSKSPPPAKLSVSSPPSKPSISSPPRKLSIYAPCPQEIYRPPPVWGGVLAEPDRPLTPEECLMLLCIIVFFFIFGQIYGPK